MEGDTAPKQSKAVVDLNFCFVFCFVFLFGRNNWQPTICDRGNSKASPNCGLGVSGLEYHMIQEISTDSLNVKILSAGLTAVKDQDWCASFSAEQSWRLPQCVVSTHPRMREILTTVLTVVF
jgi:hypothetical protein